MREKNLLFIINIKKFLNKNVINYIWKKKKKIISILIIIFEIKI